MSALHTPQAGSSRSSKDQLKQHLEDDQRSHRQPRMKYNIFSESSFTFSIVMKLESTQATCSLSQHGFLGWAGHTVYVKVTKVLICHCSPVRLQGFTHLHKYDHALSLACSRCSGLPRLDALTQTFGSSRHMHYNRTESKLGCWTLHRAQCSGARIMSQAFSLVAFQMIFHAFSEIFPLHNF